MKQVKAKLHSQRGVSILFALLLFLVASMVSVVILDAAVTSAYRIHDDREEEQQYLAVSSAGTLLRDVLQSTICTVAEDERWSKPDYTVASELADPIQAAVKRVYESGLEKEFTVTLGATPVDGKKVFGTTTARLTFSRGNRGGGVFNNIRVDGEITMEGSSQKLFLTGWSMVDRQNTWWESETSTSTDPETGEEVEDTTYYWHTETVLKWDPITLSTQKEAGE